MCVNSRIRANYTYGRGKFRDPQREIARSRYTQRALSAKKSLNVNQLRLLVPDARSETNPKISLSVQFNEVRSHGSEEIRANRHTHSQRIRLYWDLYSDYLSDNGVTLL